MTLEKRPRPYPITQEQVWEAFKLVRRKGKAVGVDGVSIDTISANPERHLYPVWKRLSNGSYFPEAVKRKDILKPDDTVRSDSFGIFGRQVSFAGMPN